MNIDANRTRRALYIAAASAFSLSLAACDQNTSAEKVGRNIDRAADKAEKKVDQASDAAGKKLSEAGKSMEDAALTAKVKSALIAEPGLKALSINVDTADGVITLNGTANSPENRDKAVQVAQNVPGVKSVRDNLVVSKGTS